MKFSKALLTRKRGHQFVREATEVAYKDDGTFLYFHEQSPGYQALKLKYENIPSNFAKYEEEKTEEELRRTLQNGGCCGTPSKDNDLESPGS